MHFMHIAMHLFLCNVLYKVFIIIIIIIIIIILQLIMLLHSPLYRFVFPV